MPLNPFKAATQAVGLVDCNNFFVSCERVFHPRLKHKPVVVVSNNDGCIIARSNEAKALGIGMAQPLFKARPLIKHHNVAVFSANFTLYGDLSNRVMNTLQTFAPTLEFYSIDEAFLDLSHIPKTDLTKLIRQMRRTVYQWTGLPVSIGVAETKTLAKLAADIAKKSPRAGGALNLFQSKFQDAALHRAPVGDIWGVGRNLAPKLEYAGYPTALALKHAPDSWVLKHYSTSLLKTVWELRGISCRPLSTTPPLRKGIMTTRSFGHPVTDLPTLRQAVAGYAARTGEKLRENNVAARLLRVYIKTNKHRKHSAQHTAGRLISLPAPTNVTQHLIDAAMAGLTQIYREGHAYQKAGVMALELIRDNQLQRNLFYTPDRSRLDKLMTTVDSLNQQFGLTLRFGAEGLGSRWRMKQELKSNRFTTSWEELLEVK